LHYFQKPPPKTLPRVAEEAEGRRLQVVAMRAKTPVQTLAQYDEDIVTDREGCLP